ncbi:hypothetical protein Tco_0920499, partial [Tanacetum coccineum]
MPLNKQKQFRMQTPLAYLLILRTGSSLSTLGRVRLSTSQPPQYTVEDGIGTHNPWKTVLGVTLLLSLYCRVYPGGRGRICLHFTTPLPHSGGIGFVVVVVVEINLFLLREIMRVKTKPTKRKDLDDEPTPPENVPPTSFMLKKKEEPNSKDVNASSQAFDGRNIKKSFKRRPWILHDQITHSEKLDNEYLDK